MLSGDRQGNKRGRQRSERSRRAVLDATMVLIEEVGVRRLTVEGIAARAGVGKSTIYRWWKSKGILALDAFEARYGVLTTPRAIPSTGSLRGDLRDLMRPIHEGVAARGPDRLWADIIGEAQVDDHLGSVIHTRLVAPYRRMQRPIFEAAVERGEVDADLDFDLLLDVLFGAYYHRLLLRHGTSDVTFFHAVIDIVLDGVVREPGTSRKGA